MKELREFWPVLVLLAALLWSIIIGLSQERPYHPPLRPKVEGGF